VLTIMLPLLQTLWLALPLVLAGTVQIVVIHRGWLAPLAHLPLDAGLTLRGRRLLGRNKTVRGAMTMIVATIAGVAVQAILFHHTSWARRLSLVDLDRVSPLAWGAILGGGYVAGELPNSFLKRQLGIAPGAAAPGRLRTLFWILDQIDSLGGVLACMCLASVPPLAIIALLAGVTLCVHPTMALLMVALGLKQRVG
jgi:CDP-archaeol synthase